MPLEISTSAIGIKHLNDALKGMTDERGQKWKRQALIKSGKAAFNIVGYAARNKSPFKTGLTKRSITISKPTINKIANIEKVFTKSGKLKKGKKAEYHIGTTLKSSFNASAPKNRKGKPVRYPFMLEVGIEPQSYPRISKNGVLHTVHRTAARKPMLFQHKALGQNAHKVVSIWIKKMGYYLSFYTKSTYKTLSGAEKAFRRTGGKGKKWR